MTTQQVDSKATRRGALVDESARLERMIEIRRVEQRAMDLYDAGLIRGGMHTCIGQEATAIGVAVAARDGDWVACTYRGHGIALALGMEPVTVLAEMLGRSNGSIGGLGGSMHLSDPDIGLLPTNGIVGAQIPIAVGAGISAQVFGNGAISVAVMGDGATNIGAFHESLNLAAIWQVPTLFVIENNLYGEHTRIHRSTPIVDLGTRASAYGIDHEIADGQDVAAVVRALDGAAERVRATQAPFVVELKTYRFEGHAARANAAPYRPAGELDEWLERDPIDVAVKSLLERDLADESTIAAMRDAVDHRVEAAVAEALAAPRPPLGAMFEHVYVEPQGE